MKKAIVIIFSLTSFLGLMSCRNEQAQLKKESSILLTLSGIFGGDYQFGQSHSTIYDNSEIGLFFKENYQEDYTSIFILQSNKDLIDLNINLTFANVEILYLGSVALVTNDNSKIYLIESTDSPHKSNELSKKILEYSSKKFSNASFVSIKGYGLAKVKHSLNLENLGRSDKYSDVYSFLSSAEPSSTFNQRINKDCASGGEGATACSCCGCSVDCSGSYYACCNPYPDFCTCERKNGGGVGDIWQTSN